MRLNRLYIIDILKFLLAIVGISILKSIYFHNIEFETLVEFVSDSFMFWGTDIFVDLIWTLPVIMNLVYVTKKCYTKFTQFNPRYKNRKRFIIFCLSSMTVYSYLYNFIIATVQTIVVSILINYKMDFTPATIELISWYSICNTVLNLVVLLLALIAHYYVYSLLAVIVLYVVGLVFLSTYIHISLIAFIHLAYFKNIIYLLLIILLIIISVLFIRVDIGGFENDFRS